MSTIFTVVKQLNPLERNGLTLGLTNWDNTWLSQSPCMSVVPVDFTWVVSRAFSANSICHIIDANYESNATNTCIWRPSGKYIKMSDIVDTIYWFQVHKFASFCIGICVLQCHTGKSNLKSIRHPCALYIVAQVLIDIMG